MRGRAALASLLAAALALPAGLGAPRAARAQAAPAPPPAAPAAGDEADRLLDEGTRLFAEEADYDGALQAFERSYQVRPSWKALNGIALVYQQQGRLVDAIATYERLLAEFGPTLSEGQTATVKRRIAELDKRVVRVTLEVHQDGARVTIDGREVAVGPWKGTVRLLPGEHVLVATLDGHRTYDRSLRLAPGGETLLTVELEPEHVKVVVQERPVRLARRWPSWAPWAVIGGGVGLALVGGGLHYWAATDFDAYRDSVLRDSLLMRQPGELSVPPSAGDEDLELSADIKQGAGISLDGLGGAAVAAGCVLLYYNQPRAVVEPVVGPGVAGAALTLRY